MAAVQEMGEPNAQTEIVRPSLEDLRRLTIPQLRAEAVNQGISLTGLRSKTLIVDTVFQGINRSCHLVYYSKYTERNLSHYLFIRLIAIHGNGIMGLFLCTVSLQPTFAGK